MMLGMPTELLRGSSGSSSSDLRPKMEVGYRLSHFFVNQWAPLAASPMVVVA
jgi:hypothetical protein